MSPHHDTEISVGDLVVIRKWKSGDGPPILDTDHPRGETAVVVSTTCETGWFHLLLNDGTIHVWPPNQLLKLNVEQDE